MKCLWTKALMLIFAAALLGCGSATEVGNPTSDIPRTITGMIDEATLTGFEASAIKSGYLQLSMLNVFALATDQTSAESPVSITGLFSMEVLVGKTYALSVRKGTETLGNFSFEVDSSGQRSNRLEIAEAGDPIDLGTCRYENGEFIPEREPRNYPGILGDPQGDGGDGNGRNSGSGN